MDTIRTPQTAEILGLSQSQITLLVRTGKLKAHRPALAGLRTPYEFYLADILALHKKRTEPKTEKRCPQCKQTKPISEFYQRRCNKDGHAGCCIECEKVYRQSHKDKINARNKRHREQNREKEVARTRRWYQENREEIRARWKHRYATDEDFRQRRFAYASKRQSLKAGATTEPVNRQEIIARDNATCYICGRGPLDPSEIHLDHVIPLIAGGFHAPENVKVACAHCNCSKSDTPLEEYLTRRGLAL